MESKLFNAYFAGFYEGEGYVSNDKSNNERIRLGIDQNDPAPLYHAQEKWGGTVIKRVRKSPVSNKICTTHTWRLSHNYALTFLHDIKPYMRIPYKIGQVSTALKKVAKGNDRRYKCKECDMDYASPSGRRRHYKKIHLNLT